jgi:hypothetical protein
MARETSPPFRVPLPFFGFGIGSLLLAGYGFLTNSEILTQGHQSPAVVSLVHLWVLGFLLSIVMGALYQMVPVVLETSLYRVDLSEFHCFCHIVGISGMVYFFSQWNIKQVGHFGSLLLLGMLFFAYNIFRTLIQMKRFHPVALFVFCSVGWLLCTMFFGLWITIGKFWPDLFPVSWRSGALAAHAHLGLLGFFINLIVGVSYRLIPMFCVSEIQSIARVWISFVALQLGTAWIFLSTALQEESFQLVSGLGVAVGFLFYFWELMAILMKRKRKNLDGGLKAFVGGVFCLLPAIVLGVLIVTANSESVEDLEALKKSYAIMVAIGVVGLSVIGMFNKIFPFLVWYHLYGPWLGKSPIPSVNQLAPGILTELSFWVYLGGVLSITGGLLFNKTEILHGGAVALGVSIAFYIIYYILVARHIFKKTINKNDQIHDSR